MFSFAATNMIAPSCDIVTPNTENFLLDTKAVDLQVFKSLDASSDATIVDLKDKEISQDSLEEVVDQEDEETTELENEAEMEFEGADAQSDAFAQSSEAIEYMEETKTHKLSSSELIVHHIASEILPQTTSRKHYILKNTKSYINQKLQ